MRGCKRKRRGGDNGDTDRPAFRPGHQGYSKYFARRRRHRASAAPNDATIAAGSSPVLILASASREPNRRPARSSRYCAGYIRASADAISTPTRTGRRAARSVTMVNTPWHASFAYLLDEGVKRTG